MKTRQQFEKWAILPAAIEAAQETLGATTLAERAEGDDGELDEYAFTTGNGVAVVPIYGVISHKIGPVAKMMGAVDTLDIMAALELAIDDDEVDIIILDIDSPGGTVAGVPELAEAVEAVQASGTKKIYAYTDSQMASAAYWLAAGANGIFAAPSADVGSVGVYLPVVDTSEALKEQGVTIEVFKSGKYKAAGFPGVALDTEVRQHLQHEVMDTYNEFSGFVQKFRPELSYSHLQGQTFTGRRAAEIGMVDGEAKNLDSLLQKLGRA